MQVLTGKSFQIKVPEVPSEDLFLGVGSTLNILPFVGLLKNAMGFQILECF